MVLRQPVGILAGIDAGHRISGQDGRSLVDRIDRVGYLDVALIEEPDEVEQRILGPSADRDVLRQQRHAVLLFVMSDDRLDEFRDAPFRVNIARITVGGLPGFHELCHSLFHALRCFHIRYPDTRIDDPDAVLLLYFG